MPKRAERRHHEDRVKDKFRKVARAFWYDLRSLPEAKKREYVEHSAVRRAHHPRHQCTICRLPKIELRNKRNREIERKAPYIND
jgi:hypothetical protein